MNSEEQVNIESPIHNNWSHLTSRI